jgi:hypothetical protein
MNVVVTELFVGQNTQWDQAFNACIMLFSSINKENQQI